MGSNRTRTFFAVLAALAFLLLGGWTAWQTRTTTVYVLTRDVPRYHRFVEDDIVAKEVPLSTVQTVETLLTNKTAIIGRYAATPLRQGAVLVTSMVVDAPPCPVYYTATGRCLPPDREAVEIPASETVAALLAPDSIVNVWVYLPDEEAAQILLQKHPLLSLRDGGGEARIVLGLTPDEVARLAPYLVNEDARRMVYATITTPDGPEYEPLQRIPVPSAQSPRLNDHSFMPPAQDENVNPYGDYGDEGERKE